VPSEQRQWPRHLHYYASALLGTAVLPLLRHFDLPWRFDWLGLAHQYWVVLAERAIFIAIVLCLIGFPSNVWMPVFRSMLHEKLRLVVLLAFFVGLLWTFGWRHGVVLTIDTVAILEFCHRRRWRAAADILIPALYLFCGLLLVSAYNDIIVSCRFFAACDAAFNSMDQYLLHGLTVSQICHWAINTLPLWFFRLLEFVYFGLFTEIGAGLILVAGAYGRKRGLQFVGTLLIAYYIALGLFYLWPSQGPYYLCSGHFARFPSMLETYASQKGSIAGAEERWHHLPLARIAFDYYIAFPCMHIVLPLIVMWFLRAWRRILLLLVVYNTILLAAIVLLEWHYVVDILAGFIVAAAAIALCEGSATTRGPAGSTTGVVPAGGAF